ncbi:hypothetical protein DERP_008950 [Dermatophagoides pteronyssinus]|uniref:Uncharacterized protein n=1 Tax=Dermatophagoides pteronyssinus TaxID=6956 RepID=A0ABQ8JNB3_DERPT|nr:hypothetical protein DERP_008950 [Dermatophagoides pteronyssinus]
MKTSWDKNKECNEKKLEKNNRDSKIKFVSYRELIVTADGVRYYPQYTITYWLHFDKNEKKFLLRQQQRKINKKQKNNKFKENYWKKF